MVVASAAATFGVATAVAAAAWVALLVVLAWRTRPVRPDAAPATMELGAESPAVAAFLASRCEVTPAATSATLVHLASRGVLRIEQVAPDQFVVRLGNDGREPLTDYERIVLDRVRDLAVNGSVPCEALALGDDADANRFQQRFAKAVVADARARGMSRSRWTTPVLAPLFAGAVVVGVLAGAALAALPDSATSSSSSSGNDNPIGAVIVITVIVTAFLMMVVRALRAERQTRAGVAAASRWLGVRAYLSQQGDFGDLPPAAVTIWGPYLAYAAALGLARSTVHALPLGPEDPKQVWSPQGGWHLVRINLPGRLDFGWGRTPVGVLVLGVLAAAFGVFLLSAVGGMFVGLANALRDVWTNPGDAPWWAPLAIFGVIMLVMAWPLLFVGGLIGVGAVQAVRAGFDLSPEEVTGRVVRVRHLQVTEKRGYRVLVVDPGGVDEVRAWCMPPNAPTSVEPGATVRARVSPRLGHVWDVAVVTATPVDS